MVFEDCYRYSINMMIVMMIITRINTVYVYILNCTLNSSQSLIICTLYAKYFQTFLNLSVEFCACVHFRYNMF